jgi:hypothetical protein
MSHSTGAGVPGLLDNSAPGYLRQQSLAQGTRGSETGGQTRRSIARMSAPVAAAGTVRGFKTSASKPYGDQVDSPGLMPAGQVHVLGM